MRRGRSSSGQNGQHEPRPKVSAESVALLLLAGVVVGLLAGYGLDRLVRTLPLFTVIGVFVGFGLALYAIYLETREGE